MFSNKPKKKVKDPADAAHAYEYAVFLLSLRLRTVGEVVKKMEQRGYTPDVIEKTIEQLKTQRFLNDQQYAEIFLENLKTYRTYGYYGIKKKMMEKKLPAATIETILQEGLSTKEEEKIARRFLAKEGFEAKAPSDDSGPTYRTFDEESSKEKQKLANRLKSRGFRGDVIAKLLF